MINVGLADDDALVRLSEICIMHSALMRVACGLLAYQWDYLRLLFGSYL